MMKKEISTTKRHFKLYKAGKLWLVAGITVAGMMVGNQVANADSQTGKQAVTASQVTSGSTATDQSAVLDNSSKAASASDSSTTGASVKDSAKSTTDTSTAKQTTTTEESNANATSKDVTSDTKDSAATPAGSGAVTKQDSSSTPAKEESSTPASTTTTSKQTVNGTESLITTTTTTATGNKTTSLSLVDKDGKALTGWQIVNGQNYYFGTDGTAVTGFQQIDNAYYFFGTTDQNLGQRQSGEISVMAKHGTYYFDETTGKAVTGVKQLTKNKQVHSYYFDPELLTNTTKTVGTTMYTIDASGIITNVTTVIVDNKGTEEVDKNGAWSLYVTEKDGTKTYLTGWQRISGNRVVYYNPTTKKMVKGEAFIMMPTLENGVVKSEGKWFYFNPTDGNLNHGLTKLPDGRMVYHDLDDNANGAAMIHGLTTIVSQGKKAIYDADVNTGALKTGWQTAGQHTQFTYYFVPGTYQAKVGELNYQGHWYDFDADGVMLTGFVHLADGRTVYYNAKGQMQYGEQYLNKKWYYFDKNNGAMAVGFTTLPDGRRVYYDLKADGSGRGMIYGLQSLQGKRYYFDINNGAAQTGMKVINGKTYYFTPGTFAAKTGELNYQGHWYDFDANGVMLTGFVHLADGRTVYYNAKGQMQYGEQYLNKKWYYFDKNNGAMAVGFTTLPDGRRVYYDLKADGSGRGMLHGIQQVNGATYAFDVNTGAQTTGLLYNATTKNLNYFDPVEQGAMATSTTVKIGKTSYRTDEDGNLVLKDGENQVNGHWYYYSATTGTLATGFTNLPDGRRVYYGETATNGGQMQYGEQLISGSWYYFDKNDGHMVTGWFRLADGRTVYYDAQGKMVHGFAVVNGWYVHFDENTGALTRGGTIKAPNGKTYTVRTDGGIYHV